MSSDFEKCLQEWAFKAADEAVAHLNTLLDGFVELDSADDEKEMF